MLEFTKYVSDSIVEGKPVDVVYLDFLKAFDKVSHERRMVKLESLGIREIVLEWMREWLKDRRSQTVVINEEESS